MSVPNPLDRPVRVVMSHDAKLPEALRDVLAALDEQGRRELTMALWGNYNHDDSSEFAELAAMRRAVDAICGGRDVFGVSNPRGR